MQETAIRKKGPVTLSALTCIMLGMAGSASAFNVELGQDAKLDMDVSLTYGAGWRVTGQDSGLLSDINADDGNRNFDKWDMVNNRISALIDIDLQYKDYGLFMRPRAYYDWAYNGSNANDSLITNNNASIYGGPLSRTDRFTKKTQDLHRDKIEILDLFGYGTFDVTGHETSLRIGRQVLSWGESLYLQNSISSAMSPVDATAANVPGAELKDIFLPVGQVTAQTQLTSNLSVSGFYQWEWDKTRIDEAGAYFSTSDLVDDAAERILIPVSLEHGLAATIDKTASNEPSDSGEYGLAGRYVARGLADTEFGLYYVNYHEKLPMLKWRPTGGTPSPGMIAVGGDWSNVAGPAGPLLNMLDMSSYYIDYAENVKLIGMSASGVLGETNLAGEISYRMDYPLEVISPNPLGFDYVDGEVLQTQVSAIHLFGGGMLWDNLTGTAEVGVNTVFGEGSHDLNKDRTTWGGTVQAAFEYYQVLNGLDLKIPVTLKFNGNGDSTVPGTFQEDKDSLGINFNFTYKGVYQVNLGYVNYLHGDEDPLCDRDMITATLKYTF